MCVCPRYNQYNILANGFECFMCIHYSDDDDGINAQRGQKLKTR